jgi:hypothetical protein
MKRLSFAPVVVLLLSLSYASLSADAPNRPAGVAAENWIPVSDRLGIVLVHGQAPTVGRSEPSYRLEGNSAVRVVPEDRPLLLRPPVGGYFMVKGAGGWARLIMVEPVKGPGDAG